MTSTGHGPLTGVRVVELGNFIAAPTAGRILAEFGADVIKVERPRTGDELRSWRLHGGDVSLLFRAMARNKRSITLDLRAERGQDIARRLIAGADIVLENFRPGTLEKWGLGPEQIRAVNPEAVLVRISGFGQTGPYRERPGFGGVAEAFGGVRHLTGYPGLPPVRTGVSLADSVAGLYAVIGALMGLLSRRAGRPGETVDVALYEAIYSLMESSVPDFDAFGVTREATGPTIPGVVPSNTYQCADGKYVVVGGNNNAIFGRLMRLIDRPDLAEDPQLQTNVGRVERSDEIDAAINAWTATADSPRILELLAGASVPSGPIYDVPDIVADPHYAARGMHERHAVRIEQEQTREVLFPGIVPKLSEEPGRTRWLGPELGAHTGEVLDELGIPPEQADELRTEGVI
ncbi:formyl-CoA transferase [Saccharopolyspora antimicrobica]|uniref:Formyl-CoA transferase n=1 Tax=Saccharopolyspora antimicrobica TaxID=455193 RepID=A0A1I4W5T5_9PSEU|nr:CaiB/BaiF CoA-transferase family protein [Saccharopolyspora antimicrobica]RKT87042.1 formyl-CoA transferase [Saccharopolyspora antimicrobica]SFN08988.1 formyl-CoA transferase [Saccharopolyspora antimicrobica]